MSSAPVPMPSKIGRYEVERPLGHGAMGQVVLAHDPVLDRTVAIKLLRGDLKIPPEQKASLVKRMRQEARASARVSHPHIVALHDMGDDAELGLYLVFEYAEGTTLKERLESGALASPAVARLAREVGDALTTAHHAGVLHRDIKPENIILSRTGAKLADFGIARVPNSTLTRDGGLLGTPAYSSPESIDSGGFSPLSDQFSMAATLYEAIAGVRAFPGEDAVAVATRISTESPRPIARRSGFDAQVDTALLRAMSKNPHDRFGSCAEFGEALAAALGANQRPQMPTMPDRKHLRTLGGGQQDARVRHAALGGAAVGALVAIFVFQMTNSLRARSADESTREGVDALALPAPAVGWLATSPPPRAPANEPNTKPRLPQREAAIASSKAKQAEASKPKPRPAASADPAPTAPAIATGKTAVVDASAPFPTGAADAGAPQP